MHRLAVREILRRIRAVTVNEEGLLRAGLECLDPAIKKDFASWLYWNVPLTP